MAEDQVNPFVGTTHCDYSSPTMEQCQDAAAYVYAVLSGNEPQDIGCMLHCLGTVYMFGVSFLHEHPDHTPPVGTLEGGDDREKLKNALEPLATSKSADANAVGAVPWGQILAIALPIIRDLIDSWLRNR